MTADQSIKEQIEARMLSGEPFEFSLMCARFGMTNYRLVDRITQRLRKAGKIAYRREGRSVVWRAVEGEQA